MDDPTPDYMNLLGMIFSMCGLMLKVGGVEFPWVSLLQRMRPGGGFRKSRDLWRVLEVGVGVVVCGERSYGDASNKGEVGIESVTERV